MDDLTGAADSDLPALSHLRWSTWRAAIANAAKSFVKDNCTDWAAALTYYAVLAIFPAAIVVVALVGLVANGDQSVDTIMDLGHRIAPGSTIESIEPAVREVVTARSSAGGLLTIGLVGTLWSASGYIGAYTRAANAAYHVREGRTLLKLRPLQIALTAAVLVLLAISVAVVVLSGPISREVAATLHLGDVPLRIWSVVKWPLLVGVAVLLLWMLCWIAPNVRQPGLRWVIVGPAATLLLVGLVSVGFGLYVANFGSYNRTYGSLGAVIAFLVWLYLVNCAVMYGVELNAALQRARRTQVASHPSADPDEPALPPRTGAD